MSAMILGGISAREPPHREDRSESTGVDVRLLLLLGTTGIGPVAWCSRRRLRLGNDSLDETGSRHVECPRKNEDGAEKRFALAAFEKTNGVRMEISPERQLLLR